MSEPTRRVSQLLTAYGLLERTRALVAGAFDGGNEKIDEALLAAMDELWWVLPEFERKVLRHPRLRSGE